MGSPDVLVIGGGIVGLATARNLALDHGLAVTVLEAESDLAAHQTGHNSGVVHSGLYYRPGSLKAELCVAGREALFAYAAERGLPHERCGKVVVAVEEQELPRLDELERRGRANGLVGIERLDGAGVREREPRAAGIAGLWVPETGITDYRAVAEAYAEDVRAAGGEVRVASPVKKIRASSRQVVVEAGGDRLSARFLVACAGLESDRVARRAGLAPQVRIVPFRGDYFVLAPEARSLVRNLVYPVPDPDLPFLGVHLTRGVDGAVEAGPSAVLSFRRDGYSRTAFSLRDTASTLAFPGFWRMAPRWARTGFGEMRRAFDKRAFVRALARLVPEIRAEHLAPGGCGIRAQALDRAGRLLDDFALEERESMIHVLNAPSPAATASLAIGARIAGQVAERLEAPRLRRVAPTSRTD